LVVKPEMIIKGGFIIAGRMGDANASIPTPQPVIYKNMFGAFGKAKYGTCVTFVSKASLENGVVEKMGASKKSASGPGMQEYLKKIYGTQQCNA